MGKKKCQADTRGSYPRLADIPRNGIVSAIGVVSDVQRKPGLDLIFTIRDESGQLLFVVRRASADTMRLLEAGDVICVEHTVMGRLGDEPAIVFNGYQRKGNFCSVWTGNGSDLTPKITTNENENVPPVLQKRIAELRGAFSEKTVEDETSDSDGILSERIENQRLLVMINQACGMNPPPLPPGLECAKDHFSSLVVSKTPTARFINNIHMVANGSQDIYFNLFAQVVSIYKLRDSFILKVWDGTEPIGLGELPKPPTAVASEDFLELDPAVEEAISPFMLNILCYGDSWEGNFLKIKPFDILLLANLHLSRRSLGELSLAMHEGMPNRRCVAVVPPQYNKAEEIRGRCQAKLQKLRPIESPGNGGQDTEGEDDCDLSNLLNLAQDGNETIKTWHTASQSQRVVVAPVEMPVEQNDACPVVDIPVSPAERPANCEHHVDEVLVVDSSPDEAPAEELPQEEPMETEESHAEPQVMGTEEVVRPPSAEKAKEQPEVVETRKEYADEELYSAIFKSGLTYMYRNPSWAEEVNLAYSLPPLSTLNFHNCLKVDLEKWRRQQDYGGSLLWTMYCNACSAHITIQTGQSTWCPSCFTKDGRLSQCDVTLRVLIPLQTDGKRLLLAAFPQAFLKVLHPDITTLSDSRCTAEFSKHDNREWSSEVVSELQKATVVDALNGLHCSSTIQQRREDVCILFISKAISREKVARILSQATS